MPYFVAVRVLTEFFHAFLTHKRRDRSPESRHIATKQAEWLSWILGAALLAVVVAAALHFSEERAFVRLTERAQPQWLGWALALQAATYVAQGWIWRRVSAAAGYHLAGRTAFELGLAKLFAYQTLPSAGLSSSILVAKALEHRRLAAPAIHAAVVVNIASYHLAYVVTLSGALVILISRGNSSALVMVTAVLFLIFSLGLGAGILVLPGQRGGRHLGPIVKIPAIGTLFAYLASADARLVQSPRVLAETIGLQVAIMLLDAATIWTVIRALGATVSVSGVFASFMIASLFQTVGLVPGGLGTFEATLVLMLRMVGVDTAVALSATLLFRGFSFWLPLLPGYWCSRRLVGRSVSGPVSTTPVSTTPSTPFGLTGAEAAHRLAVYGPNEPAPVRRLSVVVQLLQLFANPLVIILLVASAISGVLRQRVDALIIVTMVVLGVVINFWQSYRSQQAAERLRSSVTPTATVLRDGTWVETPMRNVVPGDVFRLAAGDLVPADAQLLESRDLSVQQSMLTGESFPADKTTSELVFLGTSVVSGTGRALATATGPNTKFGDIAVRLQRRAPETEFEHGLRRFSWLILRTTVMLVLFIVLMGIAFRHDAFQTLLFAVALGVGLTPEFLPMISAVTLTQGALRMAREQVIVKHLPAIQDFGSIDILCSDKTGTLTSGMMQFDRAVDPMGSESPRPFTLASINSRFQTGIRSPLDTAILQKAVDDMPGYQKVDEIPFDFERRRLSVVMDVPGENSRRLLIAKGAPESILEQSTAFETAGQVAPLSSKTRQACAAVHEHMSEDGLRVLAVAYRWLETRAAYSRDDEMDLVLAGFISFADPVLPDVGDVLAQLKRDGITVKILTGDNERVARHLCRAVALDEPQILTGDDIERTDDAALGHAAEQATLFARVSPAQKNRIILALKRRGHVVGFIGDGINDAPSLHSADVGLSVMTAADVAREAADIILGQRGLRVLHRGILEGRRASGNMMKYLLMGTSSNFGNMFSMAAASVFLPFLPMLPTQILLNSFLYDLAQITIPSDNVDDAYLRRPQRWDMRVVRDFMLFIGPISSIFDFLTFYVLLHYFHAGESLFHTGWFVESLATQTLVLFVIRTMANPFRSHPSRALTMTTLVVVAIGAVLPVTPLAAFLGFTRLPISYFAFLIPTTLAYLVLVDMAKRQLAGRLGLKP